MAACVVVAGIASSSLVFADNLTPETSILPQKSAEFKCEDEVKQGGALSSDTKFKEGAGNGNLRNYLACAISTGRIRFYMVPYFLTYLIQFLLGIAGLISVLFIVVGGFQYITGALGSDKETGKKTITHAIVGLIVSLSAWIIVQLVQIALTS